MEIDTWNTLGEGYIDNRTLAFYPFSTSGVNSSQCLTPILLLFSLERHCRSFRGTAATQWLVGKGEVFMPLLLPPNSYIEHFIPTNQQTSLLTSIEGSQALPFDSPEIL